MPRQEGPKPIGDSIRKIIDKVMKERAKNKKGKPIRTQPKLPGLKRGRFADKRKKFGSDEFSTYNKMRDMMDSQRKMQPSRSMSRDTTTGISKMKEGGICRGAGAAIKGTKFQGVF